MDVFLAVAALFATAGTLSMHAYADFGSDSVPTPYDVATVTGQGLAVVGQAALVAGEMGWLNFISPSFRDLTPQEREAIVRDMETKYGTWYSGLDPRQQKIADEVAELRASTAGEVRATGNVEFDLVSKEDKLGGVPYNPVTDPDAIPKKTGPSPVGEFFAPNVSILSTALTFVDGVTALFGLLEQPDRGHRMELGKIQFEAGYTGLDSALPDLDSWASPSALLYGIDTKIMQEIAAEARKKAGRFRHIINSQAFDLELMQAALAALTVGLTICVYIALYMESCARGSSVIFQKRAAALATVAAVGIGVTMIIWVAENTGKLKSLSTEYTDLLAKVPSSVPDGPPAAGLLASASTVPVFGGLNLAAQADRSGSASVARESEKRHGRAYVWSDSGGGFARGPAVKPRDADTSTRAMSMDESLAVLPGMQPPAVVNQSAAPARPVTSSAEQKLPAGDVDGERTGAAASAAETERAPVDIAALGPEQAAAAKYRETRRVLATDGPYQGRKA